MANLEMLPTLLSVIVCFCPLLGVLGGGGSWGSLRACQNHCDSPGVCVQATVHPYKWYCEDVDCGPLSAPANGSVFTPTGTEDGDMAFYTCDTSAGFVMVGGTNPRTCQSDGTWSGTEPVCLIDCELLPTPANGAVSHTGTLEGDTATFSCCTGYTLSGSSSRDCMSDGTWSGTTTACTVVDCPVLSDPTNGMVNTTANTFEGEATYDCDPGHELVGSPSRTCLSTGVWSSSAPDCQLVDCGPLDDPCDGLVMYNATTYGSDAIYSCNASFDLLGNATRTCEDTGLWNGEMPCCDESPR